MGKPKKSKVVDGRTHQLLVDVPCIVCGVEMLKGTRARFVPGRGYKHLGDAGCPAERVGLFHRMNQPGLCVRCGEPIPAGEDVTYKRRNKGFMHKVACPVKVAPDAPDYEGERKGATLILVMQDAICRQCGGVIKRREEAYWCRGKYTMLLHKECPKKEAPLRVYGKEPKRVVVDETCVSCGGKIPKGTETMWDKDAGCSHLTHIPDCKGIQPGEKRRLFLDFKKNSRGAVVGVSISEQTHREDDFVPGGHNFEHEGFKISSGRYPEKSIEEYSEGRFFVRGTEEKRDCTVITISPNHEPDQKWLLECLRAVDAYNEKFGDGNTGYFKHFFPRPACFGTYNGSCECAPCKSGNACITESAFKDAAKEKAEEKPATAVAICFVCGKKVEMVKGAFEWNARGYRHPPNKCPEDKNMECRELKVGFGMVDGIPMTIRIGGQTHRGKDFTPAGNYFQFEDFGLTSGVDDMEGPSVSLNFMNVWGYYESDKDNKYLNVPNQQWLHRCLRAVDAYNKAFGIPTFYEDNFFPVRKSVGERPEEGQVPVKEKERERLIRDFPEEGMRCGVCGLSIKKGSHVYFYPSEIAEGSRVSGIMIHWPGCLKLPNRNVIIEAVPRDFKCPDCGKMVYAGTRGMWISAGYPVGEFKGEMHHWPSCYKVVKPEVPKSPAPKNPDPLQVIYGSFRKRIMKATREMWDEVEGKKAVPTLTPREQEIMEVIAETFGREDAPKVALLVSLLTNNDVFTKALPSKDRPYPKRRPYALVAVPDGSVYVCDTRMKDGTFYWLDRNGLPGLGGKGLSNYRNAVRPTDEVVENFIQHAPISFILYLMEGEG